MSPPVQSPRVAAVRVRRKPAVAGINQGVKGPMKLMKSAALGLALLFVASASAMAQGTTTYTGSPWFDAVGARSIGCGLVIMGAAIGIGWLTRSAVESMARQPETAANIQTAMIISAALIEGVTFFALIIIGFIAT